VHTFDPEAIRDGSYKVKDFPMEGCEGSLASFEIGRNHTMRAEDLVITVVKSGKLEAVE